MNAFWIALLVGVFIFAAPVEGRAQSTARPPAAEEALNRGFEMAQRERWSLAIRYFGDAQELAPSDPIILFNLALANDRAAGRHIIAAAWYRAYLEAAPNAANAAKVRARVTDLEIDVETLIVDMLETVRAVSQQLNAQSRAAATSQIIGAQAVTGNLQQALLGLASLQPGSKSDWARARVAAAQAKKGDLAAAKSIARAISRLPVRRWTLAEIAVHEALRSEFAAAVQTAETIGAGEEQDFAFSRIAALQAEADDLAGAGQTAERISEAAAAHRIAANAAIAVASFKAGQPWLKEKAAAILDEGFAQAGTMADSTQRQFALLQIARARASTGDMNAARQTAALMIDARFKHLAAQTIAEAEGDTRTAAIHKWSALAHQAMAASTIQDISAFLERAKASPPKEAIQMITAAIEAWALLAQKLRGSR
ncbi:hypothetical protein L2D14_18165 [Thalassospiraceae bacterium LMO-JJ14]|nr:hypothetical protein L2D14_18165 [Thalassospiraceae bacterium LMO-JJ14]